MTYLAAILFLSSGAASSLILLRSSEERIKHAERVFAFASRLEEEIRFARTPLGDAVNSFEGGAKIMEELMCDEAASRYISSISLGTPEAAVSNAALLKSYTEKEMIGIRENEKRLRVAKAALPTLSALLVLILII